MNKIGWGQLGIVLAISRIFAEAANFPSDDINYGMQRFTVIILSYLLLGIILIPIFIAAKRNERDGFRLAENKLFTIPLIIYLLLAAVSTMTRLQFYAASTIFDAAPPWLLILFVSVVCFYSLYKGVAAVARVGVIVGGGFLVLLLTVIIGIFGKIHPEYLYPAITDNSAALFSDVITELSKNTEAVIFAALFLTVRRNSVRSLYLYIPLSLTALITMTFLYNTVLGEYLDTVNFPFYTLASLSDITVFQRLDGIDVVIWVMTAIIKLSLILNGIYFLTETSFKNRKAAFITSCISLAAISISCFIFSINTNDFVVFSSLMETGIPLITAVFFIPLGTLIYETAKKRKVVKENGES